MEPTLHEIAHSKSTITLRVDNGDRTSATNELVIDQSGKLYVVRVDGRLCTTKNDLFKHWSERFEFPRYFGFNFSALEECLSDYRSLTHGGLGSEYRDRRGVAAESVLVVASDAHRLLGREPELRRTLFVICDAVASDSSRTLPSGQPMDRAIASMRWLFTTDDQHYREMRAELSLS